MKKMVVIFFVFFTINGNDFKSSISFITPDIFDKMAYSWKDNNPITLEDLRYISVSHYGFDDAIHQGHLIVHAHVAQEVVEIFKEIFDAGDPIEKLKLVDVYYADPLPAQPIDFQNIVMD
jgi:hypothetical protein